MADNAARFKELLAKQQAGGLTPQETQEMGSLVQGATPKPGDLSGLPLPTQKDFDKDRAKAAADATTSGASIPADAKGIARPSAPAPEGQTWVQGPTGWVLAPIIKPEQMGVNPALTQDLQHVNKGDVPPAIVDLNGPEGTAQSKTVYGDNPVPPASGLLGSVKEPTPPPPPAPEPQAPAPAPATGADMAKANEMPAAPTGRPTDVGGISSSDSADAAAAKTPGKFGQVLGDIAKKTGVGLLDVIQAFAYGRSGNVGAPTRLSTATAEQAKKMEAEYMDKLEQSRMKLQQQGQKDLQANQQTFQVSQDDKNLAWDKAKQEASLAAEQANLNKTLTSEELRAKIAADTNKKYYELLYGSGAQQKVGTKIQSQFGS